MLGTSATFAADDAGWIDAHSHIWTSDVGKYPLAEGQAVEVLQPRDFTAEQLIAAGAAVGVKRFVLIQHKPHHGLDNSYLVDAMAKHPGVFSTVACVEAAGSRPQDDMRRLARLGARGFRIRPGEGAAARWRDSAGMQAMWECASETGLAMCPLIDPEDLPEVDEMCRRYPQTTVVIDHFARIGIDGEVRDADVTTLCGLAKHPRTHVKISAFYALGKKAPPHTELIPMIHRLCDAYTPARLMWATDCPYQLTPPNDYARSLELVRDRLDFVSDAERSQLLRGTAEKVFFGSVNV
jgi:predicted TIM-barrel fold metal-dependent hydrolase